MIFKKYDQSDELEVKNIFTMYWNDPEFLDELSHALRSEDCSFYIAYDDLEEKEIVGIAGTRKITNFLKDYTSTESPLELYVIASKYKEKGVGKFLCENIIEECKKMNRTEIICYSPETHNSSWVFYEKLGFIKHGVVNDPDDGYPGMLWSRII